MLNRVIDGLREMVNEIIDRTVRQRDRAQSDLIRQLAEILDADPNYHWDSYHDKNYRLFLATRPYVEVDDQD
jgi:hypothetical protein